MSDVNEYVRNCTTHSDVHELSVKQCRACRFGRCIMAGMNLDAMHLPHNVDREAAMRLISERLKCVLAGITRTPPVGLDWHRGRGIRDVLKPVNTDRADVTV